VICFAHTSVERFNILAWLIWLRLLAALNHDRSKGQRGADVETLRGTKGADFEEQGRIHRGVEGGLGWCFCLGGGSGGDENKDRLLLIKGTFCFVFSNNDPQSPKYAIALQYMRPEVKPARLGRYPVILSDNVGDVNYELSFETEEIAKEFARVVREQAETAETEQVRKRLGHEHLLNKRASVRYAQTVAEKKVKEQPDKPITTEEIANNMPMAPM